MTNESTTHIAYAILLSIFSAGIGFVCGVGFTFFYILGS